MIQIQKSETADTRTCDFANVSKATLLASSKQHIGDVHKALMFFIERIDDLRNMHDFDKITDIDGFHRDFVTGFQQTEWWDMHRKVNRHHLNMADGVRDDVNLLDVLDFIADCVMAGMARSGSVYPLSLPPELLERAFQNTVELLKREVVVSDQL
jgi:hydrogenase maturation factor HypF (carbamoyltransferase family)